MHRRTDGRTDRQTECMNTFQLCWKMLKREIKNQRDKLKKQQIKNQHAIANQKRTCFKKIGLLLSVSNLKILCALRLEKFVQFH